MRRSLAAFAFAFLTIASVTAAREPGRPVSPETLWDLLMAGNAEYVAGKVGFTGLAAKRKELRGHQSPPVTILSCSDSRVPPELIFNRSLGELFVIRVAGNVADDFGLASIEYAAAHGYTKLIVVLGHEECGAVRAALSEDEPPTPALAALVARIRHSFERLELDGSAAATQRAVEANTRAAAKELTARSELLNEAVEEGKVTVISAVYSLATGRVRQLD